MVCGFLQAGLAHGVHLNSGFYTGLGFDPSSGSPPNLQFYYYARLHSKLQVAYSEWHCQTAYT